MPPLIPMHLGALHAYEVALLALLAFGPFVVLAIVVFVIRRRDIAEDEASSRRDVRADGSEP